MFEFVQDLSGKLSDAESELRSKTDLIKLYRDCADRFEEQNQVLEREKVNYIGLFSLSF